MTQNPCWQDLLARESIKPYFKELESELEKERSLYTIFPPKEETFRALDLTSFDATKVVILGQDPYHNESEAHGLAFSVKEGVKTPPSLRNIFKELEADLGCTKSVSDLSSWAKEGVLLLNAFLSVRANSPASHQKIGWQHLSDAIIKTLSEKREALVFILWGNFARSKASLIDANKHLIITSAHPSPLSASRGFFGSKPFSRANKHLKRMGKSEVRWCDE
ncbi:MAG: uracil-DNA glycosylase [Sulfuricurvum sp.]